MKSRYQNLCLDKKEIENSIFQQVMSKFSPNKFWIFDELDTFVARSQLEKLVVKNLKRHRR